MITVQDVTQPGMMIPVPITEIINGSILPVDLYVRLGEEKFIMLAKQGTKTDQERLSRFEDRTITHLWVKQTDYNRLIQNNITIAGVLIKQTKLPVKKKTLLLTNVANTIFRDLEHVGFSQESFRHSKQIVEATIGLCESHNDLYEILESLKDCDDALLRHSMAVCAVSTLIAYAMSWDSRSTIEKLALGALLHDIGKKALPPEILNKPKGAMDYDEMQIYETHPYKGMEILQSLGVVPDDVISIVFEHHENALGQGYPRKLRNLKIHPLARVVALADEFVNMIMPFHKSVDPRPPREALIYIETTMGQPFNKEAFKALKLVVNKEFVKAAGLLN